MLNVQAQIIPTFDSLRGAILSKRKDLAIALCCRGATEHIPVHDAYMHWVAAMLTYIYRSHGIEQLDAALQFTQSTMWQPLFAEFDAMSLRTKVENISRLWHWHCTRFTVTEDDEKFTFRLDPCGSGMRIEQAGCYEGCGAYARIQESHPIGFGEAGFPVYSAHCAVNNQVQLAREMPLFIVEGWEPTRGRGHCVQHTYKSLEAVPDEQYGRLKLTRRSKSVATERQQRLFGDEELEILSIPPMQRLEDAVVRDDWDVALEICEVNRLGWPGLHDQYRDWVTLLLIFAEERLDAGDSGSMLVAGMSSFVDELYRNVISATDMKASFENLCGVWRAIGGLAAAEELDDCYRLRISLVRLYSERLIDRLPGARDNFCRLHNQLIGERLERQDLDIEPDAAFPQSFVQRLNKQGTVAAS